LIFSDGRDLFHLACLAYPDFRMDKVAWSIWIIYVIVVQDILVTIIILCTYFIYRFCLTPGTRKDRYLRGFDLQLA
jgi:hypothetical protein